MEGVCVKASRIYREDSGERGTGGLKPAARHVSKYPEWEGIQKMDISTCDWKFKESRLLPPIFSNVSDSAHIKHPTHLAESTVVK